MDHLAERINYFKEIRDIPYHIAVDGEADYSCDTKARLLAEKFQSLEMPCRLAECEFRWSELNLPKQVLELAPCDVDAHAYLEVNIPELDTWVIVDPTWDSKLQGPLPIVEWDGINPTLLAVPGFNHKVSEDPCGNLEQNSSSSKYNKKESRFLRALNKYLAVLRMTLGD